MKGDTTDGVDRGRVIAHDTFADFKDYLEARGVDTDRLPDSEPATIVDSYPYGEFYDNAPDADEVWARDGGPWADEQAARLTAAGYGHQGR